MTLPRSNKLPIPLELSSNRPVQSNLRALVHPLTKQNTSPVNPASLNYKLYHRKNNGTLVVTYKPSLENDAHPLIPISNISKEESLDNTNALSRRIMQIGDRLRLIPEVSVEATFFKIDSHIEFIKKHQLEENDFANIDWLNTPGPLYATNKCTYGLSYIIACKNIATNAQKCQVVFKQPLNKSEEEKVLLAVELDDFNGYFFNGNSCWNEDNIVTWWQKSEERVKAILELYLQELYLPKRAYEDDDIFQRPAPENYKRWLDFYQEGMKTYLEWYISKISNIEVELPELKFDWTIKEKLDKIQYLKFFTRNE